MNGVRVLAATLSLSMLACPGSDEQTSAPETTTATPTTAVATVGRDGDIVVGRVFSGAEIDGVAGGERDASRLAEGCVGMIPAGTVNHVLTVNEDQPLTLRATPNGVGVMDLMIAVRLSDETWLCADDSDTLDPVLARMFTAGEYHIAVGTHSSAVAPYTLTMQPGIHTADPIALGGRFPAPITDGVAPERTTEGTFGGLRVPAGTGQGLLTGQAGGTRVAGSLDPSCVGFIAQTPDHVLEIAAPDELMLRVRSESDTTLVVQGPMDVVYCTDDDDGLNPVLRRPLQMGRYSVYVGTYDENETPAYTLSVSR